MMIERLLGSLEEIDENMSGGILASGGVKRDEDDWLIDGIDYTSFINDNPVVDVEHTSPPVAVVERIGKTTLSNGVRALTIAWRWGPSEIPLIAETRARVKAGLYNALSGSLDPLEYEPIRGSRGVRVLRSELLGASIVKVPADPMAKITLRSLRQGTGALFRSLPRIPSHSFERAMAGVGRVPASKPIMLMSVYDRTRLYAQASQWRTMSAYLSGLAEEREREERFSYAQRQADKRALSEESTH